MTEDQIRQVVIDELLNIAPETDPAAIGPEEDIRDALDIDSMDVLNFVIALHGRLHVDIPDIDAPKLLTIAGAVAYLAKKLAASGIAPG